MHPLRLIADLLNHAATAIECRQPSAPTSTPFDGVPNMLTQILKEMRIMSDAISQFDAKLTELVTTVNTKLSAAETAREAAVTELSTTKATLADVQAKLAAMPSDTAELEGRIFAETAKITGVIDKLNGIDTTPVASPAPSEPTTDAPPADSTAEPTPVQVAPADINPAMPPA